MNPPKVVFATICAVLGFALLGFAAVTTLELFLTVVERIGPAVPAAVLAALVVGGVVYGWMKGE